MYRIQQTPENAEVRLEAFNTFYKLPFLAIIGLVWRNERIGGQRQSKRNKRGAQKGCSTSPNLGKRRKQ